MDSFLIKSTIVMVVLLALYHLLLEREKMHRFNRFYLLGAIVLSFMVPFIYIPVYIEVPEGVVNSPETMRPTAITAQSEANYLQYIAIVIYILITAALSVRFIINISDFMRKSTRNEKIPYGEATLVLLKEKKVPHTFLNYIFINEDDYKANAIENDLYTHELTHVKQWHTLDILFIEVLKTIFWFNPLLYFYKKAIQLNHEFLADEKVVQVSDTSAYQRLLLQKTAYGSTIALASNLNFSLTKKRFNMMTKTTPQWKSVFLQISVAPVITIVMMFLCVETIAQEKMQKKKTTKIPDKIEVNTVTKKELDSLQKADPVKYKGKEVDFMKTSMTYTDKRNKDKDTVYFNRKEPQGDYTLRLSDAIKPIDPAKIKSIEINQLTEQEKNALKDFDSEEYTDLTLKNYVALKTTYINDEGKLISETIYEKKPQ